MDYQELCKLIDKLNQDIAIKTKFMNTLVGDYLKELNKEVIDSGYVPTDIVFYSSKYNRVFIGKSINSIWKLELSDDVESAIAEYETSKPAMKNAVLFAAKHYKAVHDKCKKDVSDFFVKLKNEEELQAIAERGYLDFDKFKVTYYFEMKLPAIFIYIKYNGRTIESFTCNLDTEYKKLPFESILEKINESFVKNTIDAMISKAIKTGTLSIIEQKALVNWAIERQDYVLGEKLYGKRRKLPKHERDRLDSFMLSKKMIG